MTYHRWFESRAFPFPLALEAESRVVFFLADFSAFFFLSGFPDEPLDFFFFSFFF